jgi:hypothetical protein
VAKTDQGHLGEGSELPTKLVRRDGQARRQSRWLPQTDWTWSEIIQVGRWRGIRAIPVEILANFGLDRRGYWFLIEVGIRGYSCLMSGAWR